MLYNTNHRNAVKLKFCERNTKIARYGPPVHGSSTPATKAPKNIIAGKVTFLVISWIFLAFSGGMDKVIPCPYQKKSLISIKPAITINKPTIIEIYSLMYNGIDLRKNRMPNPANK